MKHKITIASFFLVMCFFCTTIQLKLIAQAYIKVNKAKINHLDKQNKKQGAWFFFNPQGEILLSCMYADDSLTTPLTFYENNDTAFIKYPRSNESQNFTVYYNKQVINGKFIFEADSIVNVILPSKQFTEDTGLANKIKIYHRVVIAPLYFFGQQKLEDYYAYAFSSSRSIFNKKIRAEITISGAGLVTHVELPKEKNNLSEDEQRELEWIYSQIPRWQPLFEDDNTKECKIRLGNNMGLDIWSH